MAKARTSPAALPLLRPEPESWPRGVRSRLFEAARARTRTRTRARARAQARMLAQVRALLRDHFEGKEPNCAVSPEEAVAHGTAIQAAILTDRKKISIGATEAGIFEHLDYER